jgi:hypothetical protein
MTTREQKSFHINQQYHLHHSRLQHFKHSTNSLTNQPSPPTTINMRFSVAAASVIALAASSSASLITVKNNCGKPVYLTTTNSQQQTNGPNELAAGASSVSQIVGQGNSLGVTLNKDYYSPNTAKLILGTSTSSGTLYWSVSSVNGNPFAAPSKFSVRPPSHPPRVFSSQTIANNPFSDHLAQRQQRQRLRQCQLPRRLRQGLPRQQRQPPPHSLLEGQPWKDTFTHELL